MTLLEFLQTNEEAVRARTEEQISSLAGRRPTPEGLKTGLAVFFAQLVHVLELASRDPVQPEVDADGMAKAANAGDEPAIAAAAGRPYDVAVAQSAGAYGKELQRLGYTLSHVVHTYGAICQAITDIAIEKGAGITTQEFRALNRCLDTAIAGAVTVFHADRTEVANDRETQHLGFLAHELRNALSVAGASLRVIKSGTVGFAGSTGQVLDRSLKRLQELIDRSLAEVRLRVDPKVHRETVSVLKVIDQAIVGTEKEAGLKAQTLTVDVEPWLDVEVDEFLLFSAVSNLIQNAIKYTRAGGTIRIGARALADQTIIEVEDQCGGLSSATPSELFKPFAQQNPNCEGLGLGLTIAHRAIALNEGTIEVKNLPGCGCIFRISLPGSMNRGASSRAPHRGDGANPGDGAGQTSRFAMTRASSQPPFTRSPYSCLAACAE